MAEPWNDDVDRLGDPAAWAAVDTRLDARHQEAQRQYGEASAPGDSALARAEAAASLQRLAAEFGGDAWPQTRLLVAQARFRRTVHLTYLDENDLAIAELARLAEDLRGASDPALTEVRAAAQRFTATIFKGLGRRAEAQAALKSVIAEHAASTHPGTRHTHALAQLDVIAWMEDELTDEDGPQGRQRIIDACDALVAAHGAADQASEAWCAVRALRTKAQQLRIQAGLASDDDDAAPEASQALLDAADRVVADAWQRYSGHPDGSVAREAAWVAIDLADFSDHPETVESWSRRVYETFAGDARGVFDVPLVQAQLFRSWALRTLGRGPEGLAVLDAVMERFGASDEPAVRDRVLSAGLERAHTLRSLGRGVEALPSLLASEAELDRPDLGVGLRRVVARTLDLAADILGDALPEPEDDAVVAGVGGVSVTDSARAGNREPTPEMVAYADVVNRLVARLGGDDDVVVRRIVSAALELLGRRQRFRLHLDASAATHQRLLGLFTDDTDPQIVATMVRGYLNYGYLLMVLQGRHADALTVYDRMIARYGGLADPAIRETLAKATASRTACLNNLRSRGVDAPSGEGDDLTRAEIARLQELKDASLRCQDSDDHRGAIAFDDQILASHLESTHPELRRRCAEALVRKAYSLSQLTQRDQAVDRYREVVDRFGDDLSMDVQKSVGLALSNLATCLDRLGRHDEELAVYDEIVDRWSNSSVPSLQLRAANAMKDKGLTLDDLGRTAEAVATYRAVVRRFLGASDLDHRRAAAAAGNSLAACLIKAGLPGEAIPVSESVIAAADGVRRPDLDKRASVAHLHLARAFVALGRPDEARPHYETAIGAPAGHLTDAQVTNARSELGALALAPNPDSLLDKIGRLFYLKKR